MGSRCFCWAILAMGIGYGFVGARVTAYTPKSPEVKQAVDRAAAFLSSDSTNDGRMGAKAVAALALLKHGAAKDHPKVAQAVEAIQKAFPDRDPMKVGADQVDIYSAGLATILLVTLDPERYHSEIDCLLRYLQRVQKPHGGWGYHDRRTGDTSMTQYGVLSYWEAKRAGFDIPQASIEAVTEWLLRTQDPSGAFGYQGEVAPGMNLMRQSGVRPSMVAAGLGSVYICADMLGMTEGRPPRTEGLPIALREVKQGPEERIKTRIPTKLVRDAQARGYHWFAQNYVIQPPQWIYYYLYALERYQSFRELNQPKPEKEPAWYNDGVRLLLELQEENGCWKEKSGAVADTAFAMLFLLRSMKQSIEKAHGLGDGTLVGGRGLPKETDNITVREGNVVAQTALAPKQSLLAALDDQAGTGRDKALEQLAELPAAEIETLVGPHTERLRQLVGDPSPEARLAAVEALVKIGDLDSVPALIYALTDPDIRIVLTARDALRRFSRRPAGFGLPSQPDQADRHEAIRQWKDWYRAIRPDAQFMD